MFGTNVVFMKPKTIVRARGTRGTELVETRDETRMMLTNNFHLYMPMYGLEAPSQYLVILKLKYPNLLLVVNHESRSLSGVNVALVAWVHLASVARTHMHRSPISRILYMPPLQAVKQLEQKAHTQRSPRTDNCIIKVIVIFVDGTITDP
jgi:hypothetical protein